MEKQYLSKPSMDMYFRISQTPRNKSKRKEG